MNYLSSALVAKTSIAQGPEINHFNFKFNILSNEENELITDVISSNHKFMLHLYQALGKEGEDTFFSPFSIYLALVLAYLGSNGETAEELRMHLHLPRKKENLFRGLRILLSELKNPELVTATEMFVEKSYELRTSYKDDAKKFLDAEPQLLDFKTAANVATQIINSIPLYSWVSCRTNNKINNLIPADTLDVTTSLVLVNVIHFKDKWLKPFPKTGTRKRKFFTSKDLFTLVDMMHISEDRFRYRENETFQVLELPYQNKNFKMVIFLPKKIEGLPTLEAKLTQVNVLDIVNGIWVEKVRVVLPKFQLDKFVSMNEALDKLGIRSIFDEQRTDFTGIHESTEGEEPLVVSQVLHHAFVDVSEEGTEASAATAVVMSGFGCVAQFKPKVYNFIADHPFIFIIFYNHVPLFIGKKLQF